MTKAFIPGSFDPPTNGHLDVIHRCIEMFDSVVVGVVENPNKQGLFSTDERQQLLRLILGDGAEVTGFGGLLTVAVGHAGADVVVKGVRDSADVAYETQFALMNRHLAGTETLLLPANPVVSFVSSSLVKELWKLGSDVSSLVPSQVLEALSRKEVS